jgi:hypothetical protein
LDLDKIYKSSSPTVHKQYGGNFFCADLTNLKIAIGHFGEIMSHRSLLTSLDNKKFIIISPDTIEDRVLLNQRSKHINMSEILDPVGYFGQEQVFLYEMFTYHYFFGTATENIMNISISEWFCLDIKKILNRIENFLNITIDIDTGLELHQLWLKKNKLL